MKSFVIIGAMCFLFIIISGFTGNPKASVAPLKTVQCSNDASIKRPLAVERKKMKTSQIPSWQRVIPGMFR